MGRGGLQDREQDTAVPPSPRPCSPQAQNLGICQACPVLVHILAHTCERLSTGCPVSMETSSSISISWPFAWAPWEQEEMSLSALWQGADKLQHSLSCCQDTLPTPQDPARTPNSSPATLPPLSPWAQRDLMPEALVMVSEALGLGPSHSRAAESFEKNAPQCWEDLLRTVRLCAGNCCSALSPPRPRRGAKLSPVNPRPGAWSGGRGKAGPGRRQGEFGGALREPPATPLGPLPTQRLRKGLDGQT